MAWLGLQRLPSTATERTQLLNDDGDRRAIPVLREQVLSLLAELPHGHGLNVEGIRDILAKSMGSSNHIAVVHATLAGLQKLRLAEDITKARATS